MNKILLTLCGFFSLLSSASFAQPQECVILLHGLARTSQSMESLAQYLQTNGYRVINMDYPSREFTIEILAEKAIDPALEKCREEKFRTIHFVTHSLGGILIRQYLSNRQIPELKRVVMLAPPNRGSHVVDDYKKLAPFKWMNGPAGLQLGTDKDSIPNTLGAVNFDLGVIAGTSTINLILSQSIPNPDDGKVSVENTKIEGMRDFIALPVTHPFIMKNKKTQAQTLHYLQMGRFKHPCKTLSKESDQDNPKD